MNKNNNHTNMITTIARTAINMDQRPSQLQNQQQQPPLKCPRCDSTNTKFCYYNNYSLSQPRHFCKACKRYWTRGGTLRNVPVGGGCRRKNKRINNKRIFSSSSSSSNTSTLPDIGTSTYPTFRGGTSTSSPSHFVNNSTLLYGLPTNYLPSSGDAITNFPFSSNYDMNPSSISSSTGVELLLGYNHQKFPGFSTSTSNPKQIIQDLISSNPNSSTFGSNTSHPSSSPSPTTSNISLYPHTLLQQHKFNFQPNFPNHSTHHDESLKVQYPKENDDDDNLDQARPSFDHADPVNNMSHSGYHHQYTNLMDPNHHQQQHEYTSISWNNHDNNAPGDGTTSVGGGHHLGTNDNNNWLDPTYSAAIETSSSSIPS